MNESLIEDKLLRLITAASADLPPDVEAALRRGLAAETADSLAARTLQQILDNVALARERSQPICQDTGTLIFHVTAPVDFMMPERFFKKIVEKAIVRATEQGVLRQNSVCSITGKNSGNNLGPGAPVIHWYEHDKPELLIELMLKGGGCENVGIQYSLPDKTIGAGRDLDGVRRCILDAAVKAQGKGCAPGVLGVAVGGDRATGYALSKELLFRRIGQRNTDPVLAEMEVEMKEKINQLGIGPMGFGGQTTVLDVFVDHINRVPASFYVSVSYMCWAYRRREISIPLTELS